MRRFLLCLIPPFLAAITGAFFRPGPWYEALSKPAWTPPGIVFPVAWNILYFLMAVTLYFLWKDIKERKIAFILFWIILAFNALWSPVFLGMHEILAGLAILLVMVFCQFLLLWRVKKSSLLTILNIPYFLWLSFAMALNAEILRLSL